MSKVVEAKQDFDRRAKYNGELFVNLGYFTDNKNNKY